jgi:hypothetical protein
MPTPTLDDEDDGSADLFRRFTAAELSGDYVEKTRCRQALYRLGWYVTPVARKGRKDVKLAPSRPGSDRTGS